ncbi:unnamed protein product, partial [Brachionus calyciflorus]
MFAMNTNKICPVEYIEWNDERGSHKIDFYFRDGPNKNQSKGLFEFCKELEIISKDSKKNSYKLEQLRKLASGHIAFKSKSKLEFLVEKFNKKFKMDIRLHFLPKKYNNQSTNEILVTKLILEAREEYKKINMNNK